MKVRNKLSLGVICLLMSVVCTGQAAGAGENSAKSTSSSEPDAPPTIEQLPIDELYGHVAQMGKLSERNYRINAGKFEVQVITPIFAAHKESQANRHKSRLGERAHMQRQAGESLLSWRKYAGDYSEAVTLMAIPEIKSTGDTKAAKALLTLVGLLGSEPKNLPPAGRGSLPPDDRGRRTSEGRDHFSTGALQAAGDWRGRFVFKASFRRMELWRGGKKVEPLSVERLAQNILEENSENEMKDVAHYGKYRYPVSAFASGAKLKLKVWEVGKPRPRIAKIKEHVRSQVWSDFESFSSAKR